MNASGKWDRIKKTTMNLKTNFAHLIESLVFVFGKNKKALKCKMGIIMTMSKKKGKRLRERIVYIHIFDSCGEPTDSLLHMVYLLQHSASFSEHDKHSLSMPCCQYGGAGMGTQIVITVDYVCQQTNQRQNMCRAGKELSVEMLENHC